jgi:hypothetical protein
MKNISLFEEEITVLMKQKLSVCKCNPCMCSEKIKDRYFQELKDILERVNEEYIVTHPRRIISSNLLHNQNSIIYF